MRLGMRCREHIRIGQPLHVSAYQAGYVVDHCQSPPHRDGTSMPRSVKVPTTARCSIGLPVFATMGPTQRDQAGSAEAVSPRTDSMTLWSLRLANGNGRDKDSEIEPFV